MTSIHALVVDGGLEENFDQSEELSALFGCQPPIAGRGCAGHR
jgi:hypothetical protein